MLEEFYQFYHKYLYRLSPKENVGFMNNWCTFSSFCFSSVMYCVMSKVVIGVPGGSQAGEVGGAPLMRVEEEGPLRKNLDSATDKPPNILVYAANNAEYYNKVQQTLASCLNPDR